jgi:hypothetical protein
MKIRLEVVKEILCEEGILIGGGREFLHHPPHENTCMCGDCRQNRLVDKLKKASLQTEQPTTEVRVIPTYTSPPMAEWYRAETDRLQEEVQARVESSRPTRVQWFPISDDISAARVESNGEEG